MSALNYDIELKLLKNLITTGCLIYVKREECTDYNSSGENPKALAKISLENFRY